MPKKIERRGRFTVEYDSDVERDQHASDEYSTSNIESDENSSETEISLLADNSTPLDNNLKPKLVRKWGRIGDSKRFDLSEEIPAKTFLSDVLSDDSFSIDSNLKLESMRVTISRKLRIPYLTEEYIIKDVDDAQKIDPKPRRNFPCFFPREYQADRKESESEQEEQDRILMERLEM